jgi:peptidoglycan/xylan/chitin deacetylase (PgdA/CDA1 family)
MLAPAALVACWCSPALAPVVPAVARALWLPRRQADHGAVAVTFDDGPHPQGTPAVLEALRNAGAQATFFLVGEQVERNPSLAAEIGAAGHTIALHGHRHRNSLRLTPRAFESDLARGIGAIAEATGDEPDIHRDLQRSGDRSRAATRPAPAAVVAVGPRLARQRQRAEHRVRAHPGPGRRRRAPAARRRPLQRARLLARNGRCPAGGAGEDRGCRTDPDRSQRTSSEAVDSRRHLVIPHATASAMNSPKPLRMSVWTPGVASSNFCLVQCRLISPT